MYQISDISIGTQIAVSTAYPDSGLEPGLHHDLLLSPPSGSSQEGVGLVYESYRPCPVCTVSLRTC